MYKSLYNYAGKAEGALPIRAGEQFYKFSSSVMTQIGGKCALKMVQLALFLHVIWRLLIKER